MTKSGKQKKKSSDVQTLEQKLWAAADKLRGHLDPSEYKHVALGLIFLKYISDAFEEQYHKLQEESDAGADPEDRLEYKAENLFWVPKSARWAYIQQNAKQIQIGQLIDDAMRAIEVENDSLKGVLPKDYSRPSLDQQRLGEIVDLIGSIGLGHKEQRAKDILGRVYEYFLGRFASSEGKGGGEFYTPQAVVKLLVEMIEPYHGRVYDPCCGSGGMFVQSEKFVEAHGGQAKDLSVYGQESNPTTWRLCKMNLAIRGIESHLGSHHADTFHNDLHKDLRADFILANPPFNISDWGGERLKEDHRWKYGIPPTGNANFAWVQHIVYHLSPNGFAGFVLANGSMSSKQSGEGEIRKALIEANMIDCMVSLPEQLFYSTPIPVCLWFLAKDRSNGIVKHTRLRDRRGEILFIDARKMGVLEDRTHRNLRDDEIRKITDAYHSWRGEKVETENSEFVNGYRDIVGFCQSAKLEEVQSHGYVLTPGRYAGTEPSDEENIPFEEKMKELTARLYQQMDEAGALDAAIRRNLEVLGYGE